MKQLPEIIELKKRIEVKVSHKLVAHPDFCKLSDSVFESLKERISPTTLKRIWGYITGYKSISNHTLNILSQFIGFQDWADFCEKLKSQNSEPSGEIQQQHIATDDLDIDDIIELSWAPDRICKIKYNGDYHFTVLKSENSKLQEGDTFKCMFFVLGEPWFVDDLRRGDSKPMRYVAGKESGLLSVRKFIKFVKL